MAGYYDLPIRQGARFKRTFRWTKDGVIQNVADYNFKSQIRSLESPDSELIVDLTQYFSVSDDDLGFDLTIPGSQTAVLDLEEGVNAYWDIFIWQGADMDSAFPFLQGLVTFDQSTTSMAVVI